MYPELRVFPLFYNQKTRGRSGWDVEELLSKCQTAIVFLPQRQQSCSCADGTEHSTSTQGRARSDVHGRPEATWEDVDKSHTWEAMAALARPGPVYHQKPTQRLAELQFRGQAAHTFVRVHDGVPTPRDKQSPISHSAITPLAFPIF